MTSLRTGPSEERPFTTLIVDGSPVGEVQLSRNRTDHGLDMYVGFYRCTEALDTMLTSEFDEAMYVVEGGIEFDTPDGIVAVSPGQYAFISKGFSCPVRQWAGFRAFVVTLP